MTSALNLPDKQVKFLGGIQITEFLARKVEMTYGLLHARYSCNADFHCTLCKYRLYMHVNELS